mmetsp:Transcript_20191/g.58395  ORF Transcript_20191/g.58395 Transcript_20191/m.58395 type:complete len:1116 (-) Transcript_20191:829-4176(-)
MHFPTHINYPFPIIARKQTKESFTHTSTRNYASMVGLSNGPGTNFRAARLQSETTVEGDIESFSSAYGVFIRKLQSSQCFQLVQRMRIFVATFIARSNTSHSPLDDSYLTSLSSCLNDFVGSLLEEFQPELIMGSHEVTRQCLETFIYSHCHELLWPVVSLLAAQDEDDMEGRLRKLQFVTPSHLEINCLAMSDYSTDAGGEILDADSCCKEPWEELLTAPIEVLQQLHIFQSPRKVLDCVLGVYRGIIHALSSTKSGTAPGADDVLPTFILVLLRAQPKEIMSVLRFVECCAQQSSLRGEAGYAFTSLFSAVQYVRELDCDQFSEMTKCIGHALSISPKDFCAGVEESTKKTKGSERTIEDCSNLHSRAMGLERLATKRVSVRPSDVRIARHHDVATDLAWVQTLQQSSQVVAKEEPSPCLCDCGGSGSAVSRSKTCGPSSSLALNQIKQICNGVKHYSSGHWTEALQLFKVVLNQRRVADITNTGVSVAREHEDRRDGELEKNDGNELMHRLSHLFATLPYSSLPKDLYVYQRDIYDEGMGTFSDLLLVEGEQQFTAKDIDTILHYNMALVNLRLKRFKEAYDHLYIAYVEEKKRERNPFHSERTIAILHNIGRVLYLLGRYEDSLAVFAAVLRVEEKHPEGQNLLYIASTKTCIGCVRWRILETRDNSVGDTDIMTKEVKDILQLQLEALNAKEGLLGKGHSSVAVSFNLLGCMYADESMRDDRDVDKALVYFQKCLKIRRSFLPEDHPDISQVLYNVARIYHNRGTLNQAMDLYSKCLEGLRKNVGNAHRDVSATLLCMSWIYRDTERGEDALACCKEALEIGRAAFAGGRHAQIGMICTLLGHIHQSLGERDQALDHIQSALGAFFESLSITRALHGEKHPRYSSTLLLIADIQKLTADYDSAVHSYQLVLPILRSCDDSDLFELATTFNSLGYCFAMKGDLMDAVKMYTATVNLKLEEENERQVVFAHAFNSLGVIFTKLGKRDLAREALQESERVKAVLQNRGMHTSPVVFEHEIREANPADESVPEEPVDDSAKLSEKNEETRMKRIASRDSQLVAQLVGLDEGTKENKPDSVMECFLNTLDRIRDDGRSKRATLQSEGMSKPIRKQ